MANTEIWRSADFGAVNGHTNAAGIANILSVIAPGGEVNGHRYLSQATINRIFEEQAYGTDLVVG